MSTPGGRRRPEHIITPDEVDAWLADSVVKVVTYHRTTDEAATDIIEYGVDLERSRTGAYGQGFYTATSPEAFRGPAQVALAVKTRRPLIGTVEDVGGVVDDIVKSLRPRETGMTRIAAEVTRMELLRLGYDGIIVWDAGGDGIDYIVAIDSESVKVVLRS